MLETPLRVVVADDDEGIHDLLRALFDGDPRFVLVGEARTGAEAVTLVLELEPDVILMDLNMPVLDGAAATAAICSRDPHACVIGISSSRDPLELSAMRAAGAVAVLPKPFDPNELLDVVEQHALDCAA